MTPRQKWSANGFPPNGSVGWKESHIHGVVNFDGHMDSLEVLDFSSSFPNEKKSSKKGGILDRTNGGFRGEGNSYLPARFSPSSGPTTAIFIGEKLTGYGQSSGCFR